MTASVYIGCYRDRSNDRDLTGANLPGSDSMTIKTCLEFCRTNSYAYASNVNGNRCFCDNAYGKHGTKPLTECNKNCTGNAVQSCGGNNRGDIYSVGKYIFVSSHQLSFQVM